MHLKWHFQDESKGFNVTLDFTPKSAWHPPKEYACLEAFLCQVEKEIFEILFSYLKYSNMSKEECLSARFLAVDRSTVIKKADRGSCVVVWEKAITY